MAKNKVIINRSPVLTLWAAVVAERLGHKWDESLTLGRALAGLNAQSKGRRIGVYEQKTPEEKQKEKKEAKAARTSTVPLMGRAVPVKKTAKGLRATSDGHPIDPDKVETYLEQKFGDDYEPSRAAMQHLANSYPPRELESQAFELYEKFRPSVPDGMKGWGAKGELDLDQVRSLAK